MTPTDTGMPRRIAVFDIGKTNARVILADLETGQELATRRMENRILPGPPFPHLDVQGQAEFLMKSLADFQAQGGADAVIAIAHGATFALIDAAGLALPVLDYEYPGPDEVAAEYDSIRPPFAVTGSPRMPGGLNIGAQLFWLRRNFPEAFASARQALFWPQYWTWWLTGRAVSEISYATSHGDLWSLERGQPIDSAPMRQVIGDLFPPLSRAYEPAGQLRPDLAAQYGLPDGISVYVGAHDSSMALVPSAGPGPRQPCVVMSTGTWLTAFAIAAEQMPQAEAPGVMASLDIFGRLVPNFRFMAGKARADLLAVPAGSLPVCPPDRCRLEQDPVSGLFRLIDVDTGDPVELAGDDQADRAAAIDHILAREAAAGLRLIRASGPIHMTGPFAENAQFVAALQKDWPFPVTVGSYEESLVAQVAKLLKLTDKGTPG